MTTSLVSDPAELVARRHANVSSFLGSRGLDPAWLGEFMRARVGPGQLLLTSSPVHGLANATSDLDFIRIQEKELSGPRIATKIFERGEHLEVVSFTNRELGANLAELTELATRPVAETVAAFRGWDKRREPRRKQTERIVNGVTLDGDMPYLAWLPALSVVWSRASLQNAIEQAVHLALSEAAGETRGRVGYAVNTLLHAMDALLSHHGDVYTTRKWYLLRWTRMVREGAWRDAECAAVAEEVERLRAEVAAVLARPGGNERLAAGYLTLVTAIAGVTAGVPGFSVALEPVEGAEQLPFLPGAAMLTAPGCAVMLPGTGVDLADGRPMTCADLERLPRETAAALLRATRAGALRQRVLYHERKSA